MNQLVVAQPAERNSLAWAYSVAAGGGIQNLILGTLAVTEDPEGICHCAIADLRKATGEADNVVRRAVDLLVEHNYVYRLPRQERTVFGEWPCARFILLHDDIARKLARDYGWGLPREISTEQADDIFADEDDDEIAPEVQRYVDFLNGIPNITAAPGTGGGIDISGHGWIHPESFSAALQSVRWEPSAPASPAPEDARSRPAILPALSLRRLFRRLRNRLRGL